MYKMSMIEKLKQNYVMPEDGQEYTPCEFLGRPRGEHVTFTKELYI
jgi:hypothetical protein